MQCRCAKDLQVQISSVVKHENVILAAEVILSSFVNSRINEIPSYNLCKQVGSHMLRGWQVAAFKLKVMSGTLR